jgi:hypothetical protein
MTKLPDHNTLCNAAARLLRLLRSKQSRRACGYTQRWQAETVVSMIKRNLGDELRGKTARVANATCC